MDFQQNFFEIFQLDETFQLDLEQLSRRYRELQKSVHPDKFAAATDHEKRLSAQWTAQINEAYSTLKQPLSRAVYLLELQGISIENNPILDPAFLMEQIELREDLEEIETLGEDALPRLDEFKRQIQHVLSEYEQAFDRQLSARSVKDTDSAELTVYKMQFVNKILIAANQLEEKLLDY